MSMVINRDQQLASEPKGNRAVSWGKLASTGPPHSKGEVLECGSSVAGSPDDVPEKSDTWMLL